MPTITLTEVVREMLAAIELESGAVRSDLGTLAQLNQTKVTNGRLLNLEPGAYLYGFEIKLDRTIPADTQVQLTTPTESTSGEVFDHDVDFDQIRFTVRHSLGDTVEEAVLQFDTSHLLTMLAARLQAIEASPGDFQTQRGLNLLTGRGSPCAPRPLLRGGLDASQTHAVAFAMANDVSYLWGPPGTGKTHTVANLVHEMVGARERVLLTAHTNIATDNALLAVLRVGPLPVNSVVRIGYHSEELRRFEVGLDDVVGRVLSSEFSALCVQMEDLCQRAFETLAKRSPRLVSPSSPLPRRLRLACSLLQRHHKDTLLSEAVALQQQISGLERLVLARAQVVATTLTRLYTSSLLEDLRTENLVLDEASVASLAQCLVAGSLATRRAVAIGDFMQLPTIVQSEHPQVRSWLGRHVFASAGADQAEGDHPLRAMLVEQYRMHPQIASLVSQTFYAGKLKTAEVVARQADAGPAILLVDSVDPACASETSPTGSKSNPFHARLVAELVGAAGTKDIAVITPYRAQVRLIREELRRLCPGWLETGELEVFTVHRFQGRDKELVIFDTVEAPGTRCNFLNEIKNPDAPNLVNVALSRARRRLIVVAHLPHLTANLSDVSMLGRIFTRIRTGGGREAEWGYPKDRTGIEAFLK